MLRRSSQDFSPYRMGPASGADEGVELGRLRGTKVGTFKEVEAARLKFRGHPEFDPGPYLDAVSRSIYQSPFGHAMKPEDFEGTVPKVRVHCSREERIRLYKLLDESSRIRLFTRDAASLGLECSPSSNLWRLTGSYWTPDPTTCWRAHQAALSRPWDPLNLLLSYTSRLPRSST